MIQDKPPQQQRQETIPAKQEYSRLHRIPPELKVVIPGERTAQYPAERREDSRLLVLERRSGEVVHIGRFADLTDFIPGDLLVLNETRVIPARVEGRRPGGGRVELLLLIDGETAPNDGLLRSLVKPGRQLKPGLELQLPGGALFTLQGKAADGGWHGRLTLPEGMDFRRWLEEQGQPPLPPYIKRSPEPSDRERYQTVYAHSPGSLAAPTAGLHFSQALLQRLEKRGCNIVRLTLDVGLGTFIPIRGDDIARHPIHTERYHIPEETAAAVGEAFRCGRSVVSVGTTVVRALEHAATGRGTVKAGSGVADNFIRPPYQFQATYRLVTNFHRPDSTLMQLLAAFIGWDAVNRSYKAALDKGFRFYSYGDAMLVL